MIDSVYGEPVEEVSVEAYFSSLVNRIFKILPIREREESTLGSYLDSLCLELIGCGDLLPVIGADEGFLTLLATIRSIRDHPELPVPVVRREVFRAISVCKKMMIRFGGGDAP